MFAFDEMISDHKKTISSQLAKASQQPHKTPASRILASQ
jgi:hypothetical protein